VKLPRKTKIQSADLSVGAHSCIVCVIVFGLRHLSGSRISIRILLGFVLLFLFVSTQVPTVSAQAGPEKGDHDLQLWTGGGHGLNSVTSDTGVWNVGLRYGWVLTNPHGPGFLRGRFEYAVDAVPIFWLFEPGQTAYGVGLDPFALKWNLAARGRVVPYLELGGGVVFTNVQAPPGTSRVNFTSSSALGMHVLGAKLNWSAEVRYMHISNAGLSSENPGINTLQLRLGIGMFTRGHGNSRNRTSP
jgi:Lipid A 3-O-deacylase (PagL)